METGRKRKPTVDARRNAIIGTVLMVATLVLMGPELTRFLCAGPTFMAAIVFYGSAIFLS